MPPQPYLRCRHCKGFYEADLPSCKWCNYQTPVLDLNTLAPQIYPDRETCRAIQIAEYQKLPPQALDDPMAPPESDLTLLCSCLHCGPQAPTFEAIEMRWIENEKAWACPCTTCGGRGFNFDIHSAENKWQCSDCGHFYLPPEGDYHVANAKCPRCGSTQASGWFDDDYDEDDLDEWEQDEDDDDDEDEEDFITPDLASPTFNPTPSSTPLDPLPWQDPAEFDEQDQDDETPEYDLGITWKESDSFDNFESQDAEDKIPDDIDYPRTRDPNDADWLSDDDIPF